MDFIYSIPLFTLVKAEAALVVFLLLILIYKTVKLSKFAKNIKVLNRNTSEQLQAQKDRDDFLAMLVHELRSPLSVMKGASDLILKDAQHLNKGQIEILLTQIRTSSTGMLKIVNDILDVSKINSGKFEISKNFGDVNKTLKDECDYYKTLASVKNVQIDINFDESLPSFNFDSERIRQVMNNLLSNAIKFTSKNGKVLVTTKKNQKLVEVTVADTGEGIADESKQKLFNKFVQLKSNNKETGTGLGLVIAKGIIEAHKGKIWIEDNKPQGTKFIFSLPLS